MERLQQDSTMSLEQHRQEVAQALSAATDSLAQKQPEAKAAAPVAEENPFVKEGGLSLVGGQPLSVFVSIGDDLLGNRAPRGSANSLFVGGGQKPGQANSLFVGGNPQGKAARASVPIMPMGYAEKKEAARRAAKGDPLFPASRQPRPGADLGDKATLAGLSLTGASLTGQKPAPVKGAAVTEQMARTLGLGWLMDEMQITDKAIRNPYEKSPKRLIDDLIKGKDLAEKFVEYKPEAARAILGANQKAPSA